MSRHPQLPVPDATAKENEYVHIRSLIANIHRPRNVCRPPSRGGESEGAVPPMLTVVQESPSSSEREESSGSERVEGTVAAEELRPPPRTKSNSIAGSTLAAAPGVLGQRRRRSFLHLHLGGGERHAGPLSAGPRLNVPRFTVTAPPGEQQRRHSHAFTSFHGFALRRHSNTVCARVDASRCSVRLLFSQVF